MSEDISFSIYDQINSGFVAIAALFYVLNLLKLIKDKEVKALEKEVKVLEKKKKVNKREVGNLKRKVTNTKKQIATAEEAVKTDDVDEAVKYLKKFSK